MPLPASPAATSTPTFTLNGHPERLPEPPRVDALIARLGLTARRVAVEINGRLAPRSAWADTPLAPHDAVEIVQAIGGG